MANKTVFNFSGGMNVKASPLLIKDSESELLLNYNLDTVGSLTKRSGYATFANAPNAAKNINGLSSFVRTSGTSNVQLMVQNNLADTQGIIYRRIGGSGSWAENQNTETVSRKTRFSSFLNHAFRVNGADAPISSNLTGGLNSWGTTNLGDKVTGTVFTKTAQFTEVYKDRVYFANDGTDRSRLWFSSLPAFVNQLNGAIAAGAGTITIDSTTSFASQGTIVIEGDVINYTGKTATTFTGCTSVDIPHPDNTFVLQYTGAGISYANLNIVFDTNRNYVDVNPDDSDQITGLQNNGKHLLIFKNLSLYRWIFGQVEPDRLIGVGTSSQESIQTDFERGITFFANPKGVYAYTGARPKKISRKIQKWIDAVSDFTEVYGGLDGEHYYLSVGNVTVDSVAYTNVILVYHITLDAWTIYSLANAARFFGRLRNSNEGIADDLYFGSTNGQVYQLNSGTDDAGTAINGQISSKEYMLAFPGLANLKNLDIVADQHTAVNVSMRTVKRHDPFFIGKLNDRVTNFSFKEREVRSTQLVLTDNSANTSSIEGWNFEYDPIPRPGDRVKRSNYKES